MRLIHSIVAASALTVAGAANAGSSVTHVLNYQWDGSMFSQTVPLIEDTITITDDVASIDSITVVMAHTWANDLDITVNYFTSFDLMFNEGGPTDLGDGGGSALANALPYEFVPIGTPGAYTSFGAFDPNPAGMYEANAWDLNPYPPSSDFTLRIFDLFEQDGGAVQSWTINYTPVPTPGALALLGLAGITGRRRRRA